MKILIADDHDLIRQTMITGLKLHLPDAEYLEAEDGAETVSLAISRKPDIVFMDIEMPEMDGVEATKTIKAEHPDIKIIMLSMYCEHDVLQKTLTAGADGYLQKFLDKKNIHKAVEKVLEGGVYISEDLEEELADEE